MAAARLPIVREAAESGEWNALILLGGGEPGADAAREIGRKHGLPVTSCATSQMHVATMLGNKFSVVDLADSHSMYYYNVIVQARMTDRCASIRTIDYPLGRPGHDDENSLASDKDKALAGEKTSGVEAAIAAAAAAIEEDGADLLRHVLAPTVRQGGSYGARVGRSCLRGLFHRDRTSEADDRSWSRRQCPPLPRRSTATDTSPQGVLGAARLALSDSCNRLVQSLDQ